MKTITHKMVAATIVACTLFTAIFAQNAITGLIRDNKGTTNHFTNLQASQQVKFNVANARLIFGLNSNSDLVLMNSETDQIGFTHYRYYQTYAGYPIENTMYIAHTKNGLLTGMSGSIIVDFDAQMSERSAVSIPNQQAIQNAMQYVHAQKYAWQDAQMEQRIKMQTGDANASYYPRPMIVWYNAGDDINPRDVVLAYKVDIYSVKPFDRKFVFVSAQSGRVLGTKQEMQASDATGTANTAYSGTQTIHSDLNGSSYRLRDLTKGNGVITLHASGHTDYTSSSPNWTLTGQDQYALDAHYGVAATWTFYKNNFNRNSVDNNGFALTSWVNDPNNPDNADWDGSEMDYGNLSSNGHGITAIDVTGHELTHGVTQYTSNLNYSNESGAMNESMSDCMGKSVQFYTKPSDVSWILSNDMNWEIRNMSNPNADGQPDTYKGTDWYSGSSDNGGVHTNSGVGNFMFYLLVTGGSGTNDIGNSYTVSGIGLSEADQILYRTNTTYLTSTSKYADWRTACINSATDLYGGSSNEVIQVENAWYAVGIGTAGGGGGCGTPSGLSASSITSSSATVSWSAVSGATSYNLQYKVSTSSTWTTITGITTTSRSLTSLSASTTYNYEVQAVCAGGSSAYSSIASFTTSGTGGSYCASKGNSTAYEYINKVAMGSINNTSGNNNGYADYTAQSTSAAQGSSQSITLTPGFVSGSYTEYWTVYIDYNHNGILNDAGETVATGSGSSAITKTFTIPSTATVGSTRMRIQMHYGSSITDPCSTFDYGEVEDYTVNITAAGSCGTPAGLTSSNITSSSATVSWGAVSGATSYNLQYKVSTSSTWTTVSGITGTSYNLTSLASSTTYNYQVQTVCSGGSSSYSAASSFTTSSGTVTYCASKGTSTQYEYINKVALGSISNTSGDNAGYGNYTNLSTNLAAGTSNTITLTPGFHGSSYTEYWTVYIDYNQNGVLNDAGETVATGSGSAAISKSFTVPTTAKSGSTRMRIQMHYGSSSTNPCATLDYGEVEDYTVNITGGTRLEENASVSNATITIYPNPVNNLATASYKLNNDGNVMLKVVDIYGRELQVLNLGAENSGDHVYALKDITSLSSGNYIVLLYEDNQLVARNKFMIVK